MALVLGGFIFRDYAIPERVPLGGEQHFVTHRLVGGARVIDAMGQDDSDLEWSGRFQGRRAVERAMALDQLRKSGAQVPLIIDSQFYIVGVRKFEWDYERWYQVIYKISCIVASSGGVAPIVATCDGLVNADLTAANALVNLFATGAQ